MTTAAMPTNCTFSESDWHILARFWYPVALSSEVQGAPWPFQLLDKKLVAFRHSQGVSILNDLCPHRGVPLSLGRVEQDQLVCRAHGSRFCADGSCIRSPLGMGVEDTHARKLSMQTYPAIERYGLLWTCLAPVETTPDIPQFPQWDDPDFEPIPPVAIDIKAAAGRQVESFMDVAHFAWVHADSFADRANPVVPQYVVEETKTGIHATYASSQPNLPKELHHTIPEGFSWVRDYTVFLPFTVAFFVTLPQQNRLAILNSASPVSARKTRLFAPTARTFEKGQPLEPFYKLQLQIFSEDQAIVEHQHPEDLPVDLSEEVHIRADRSSIAYRNALRNLGLGRLYTA